MIGGEMEKTVEKPILSDKQSARAETEQIVSSASTYLSNEAAHKENNETTDNIEGKNISSFISNELVGANSLSGIRLDDVSKVLKFTEKQSFEGNQESVSNKSLANELNVSSKGLSIHCESDTPVLHSGKDTIKDNIDNVKEISETEEPIRTQIEEKRQKILFSDVCVGNVESDVCVLPAEKSNEAVFEESENVNCFKDSVPSNPNSVESQEKGNCGSDCNIVPPILTSVDDTRISGETSDSQAQVIESEIKTNENQECHEKASENKNLLLEKSPRDIEREGVSISVDKISLETSNILPCSAIKTSEKTIATECVSNVGSETKEQKEMNDECNEEECDTAEDKSENTALALESIEQERIIDSISVANVNDNVSVDISSDSQDLTLKSDLLNPVLKDNATSEVSHSNINVQEEEEEEEILLTEDCNLDQSKEGNVTSHADVNQEEEEIIFSEEDRTNENAISKELSLSDISESEELFLNEDSETDKNGISEKVCLAEINKGDEILKSDEIKANDNVISEAITVVEINKGKETEKCVGKNPENESQESENVVSDSQIEESSEFQIKICEKDIGRGEKEVPKDNKERENSVEKSLEEMNINKEREKDSEENSCDVEFVQIDSDKDENSQQSLNETANKSNNRVGEKDPIEISNEESKDNDINIEQTTNQAIAVDEEGKEDGIGDLRSVDTTEEPDSVDISEMCETVLEESSSVIYKSVAVSMEVDSNKSLALIDDDNADVEIIDPELEDGKKLEKSKNKPDVVVKVKRGINAVSRQNNNSTSGSNLNDDEEICIIPDSVPGKGEGKKASKVNEQQKEKEMSPEAGNATDGKRTPSRPQRQAAKKAESQIKEMAAIDEESQLLEPQLGPGGSRDGLIVCDSCFKLRNWIVSFKLQENGTEKIKRFCSQECAAKFKKNSRLIKSSDPDANSNVLEIRRIARKCAQCSSIINGDEKNLSWETMDYCNEECLGRYQKILGSQCANCRGTVAASSLGKYCVRFGYDVKQFCCSGCLEEFKKGLKVCSYCQKDISGGAEGFLAPVGDKGQFKDFCTQSCMEKYDQMSNNHAPPVMVHECAVCNNEKVVSMEVIHKKRVNKFCSEPCFAAFRFVNGMVADQCFMCKKYFDKKEVDNFSVYSDDVVHSFCTKTCMNVYILANRKIVPCHWCKVKKYNFDMIKRVYNSGQLLLVCSLNCLSLYQVGVNTVSCKRIKCDMCGTMNPPQYNLNMSDNTVRNFCSYLCVMKFQEQYTNTVHVDSAPFPTGGPKRFIGTRRIVPVRQNEAQRENVPDPKTTSSATLPVISSVHSLASDETTNNTGVTTKSPAALKQINNNIVQNTNKSSKIMRQIIIRPPSPKQMRNKGISCRPKSHTKGTHCRPIVLSKETQTDTCGLGKTVLIPVPVPIYVPTPMCMYSTPFPVPVPFPLPVPVPIFIPTTRNSAKGIMKEIKRIQEKIPTDPFEAELLMMAEIVAGQKKEENSDSDNDAVDNIEEAGEIEADVEEGVKSTSNAEGRYSPETVDASNTFGDDMLQMALKMATELEEPTDLEAALTTSTITPQPTASLEQENSESEDDPEPVPPVVEVRLQRGRKRQVRSLRSSTTSSNTQSASSAPSKRRRVNPTGEPALPHPSEPVLPPPVIEQEKPDANMCLKYTLGVNAWKRWVLTKNAELEKAAANNRKLKLFKTEILQLTADELNYSLCLFVKEVRKPNGQEYAPDTIYYLCLGIQQYLFESGRIDNIFTDPYYEKFTECLDEVAKKFSTLYNDSQYIVTRVEEEHLWESKQLGAHSPHVLLTTLMFFNTKHFNLVTVEEHMQLSFSHIMKHWKRNPNQSGPNKSASGTRNVLLRYYPPQSALEANSKKKKVYEQQENEDNILRCPVKLYEFYLSKCPESVKTRNDVFYLLPERSCVPDSPVWYSTMPLGKEPLMKMLHRVKMVKEINQALLKS